MEYLRIGLITRPHGVHGALKVQPLSEEIGRASCRERVCLYV